MKAYTPHRPNEIPQKVMSSHRSY